MPARGASGVSAKTGPVIEAIRWRARHRLNAELMDERRSLPPSWVLDCVHDGLTGMLIPVEYGGHDLSYTELVDVAMQLGAVNCNWFTAAAVNNTLFPPTVLGYATEEIHKEILPKVASGQAIGTSAVTEPGMGSNLKAMTTRAIRQPDGTYILHGVKRFISFGAAADEITVEAQTEDIDGRRLGITAFVVNTRTPGFVVGREERTLGLRAVPQHELIFDNLVVPAERRLGDEGQGLVVAQSAFQVGRLTLAAGITGAAKRALGKADTFAEGREVATGILAENGEVGVRIPAEAIAAIRAVERLVHHTAALLDNNADGTDQLLFIAKAFGCEQLWQVINTSVQMLGGRGFTDNDVVGQMFRDYRLFPIFEGASWTLEQFLGTKLWKRPDDFRALTAKLHINSGQLPELLAQAAKFTTLATKPGPARHRHTAAIARLAAWGVVAALTSDAVHRGELHPHVAVWCEEEFRTALQKGRATMTTEFPTRDEIRAELDNFRAETGDLDGGLDELMPGERYGQDRLLRG